MANRALSRHERLRQIAAIVDAEGTVSVNELSERFSVSPMTIRRDIGALDHRKQLRRVRGGGVKLDSNHTLLEGPAGTGREEIRIAALAAQRVSSGTTIGLTAGSATHELARNLVHVRDLTVITNSIAIAGVLTARQATGSRVVITGGVATPSGALAGPIADQGLASLWLDHVFVDVHGIAEVAGFTAQSLTEARTIQAFIRSAVNVAVLADSSKWGVAGLSTIAPLAQVDELISDVGMDGKARHAVEAQMNVVRFA